MKTDRKIVCLCGSARFFTAFVEANAAESLKGNIVLTLGCFVHPVGEATAERQCLTAEQKCALDALHLEKVALADEVLVLNVGGYVGDSTEAEIVHAAKLGKKIRFLRPVEPCGALAREMARARREGAGLIAVGGAS